MAGALEEPLFFSSAMITTSSRLQYLDSHFSLHARLSGRRPATSKPHIDRMYSSPPLLVSSPLKNVKRSTSRSSHCSDAASFRSVVFAVEEDVRKEKTVSLLQKEAAVIVLEEVQPDHAPSSKAKAETDNGSRLEPGHEETAVLGPPKASPEQPYPTNQEESTHRAIDPRRRTSTRSEPLPSSSIPRRTSSTAHRRQRKGQDLISFHRHSCRFFQSLEGILSASYKDSQPILSRHSSLPGTSSLLFSQSLDLPTFPQPVKSLEGHSEDRAPSDSKREVSEILTSTVLLPVSVEIEEVVSPMSSGGVTVMSWTTAETREREYKKIDQAHRGFRGLWKRLTPKWCHSRNGRRKFFEGKCDGDSVRRYRV